MSIQAIVFDAYGTLFDVYSIAATAEKRFPGKGGLLAALWRDKQIEYTRLRTMSRMYKPFWEITQDALVYCCRKFDLNLDLDAQHALMSAYARLQLFPECRAVLETLRGRGHKLAILSNANPQMLEAAVQAAGVQTLFHHLLSVDSVGQYKTVPEAYAIGTDLFGLAAKHMLFVSANHWDVCGASWFGYKTFWVNRDGAPPEELGVTPHGTGVSLADLPAFLEAQAAPA